MRRDVENCSFAAPRPSCRMLQTETMNYSRQNPSPRYQQLVGMYRDMHLRGERGNPAAKTFDGRSLAPQAPRIKRAIERSGSRSILDYGSGKGMQYDATSFSLPGQGEWDSVLDYWGVEEVVCFDPAYPPYTRVPQGQFDGVIATDVLEHCPEEDMEWIVAEMFGFAARFVYATIACYPAARRLPNGENAHCTIRRPEWWDELLRRTSTHHPGVEWEVWLQDGSPVRGVPIGELRLASWAEAG